MSIVWMIAAEVCVVTSSMFILERLPARLSENTVILANVALAVITVGTLLLIGTWAAVSGEAWALYVFVPISVLPSLVHVARRMIRAAGPPN